MGARRTFGPLRSQEARRLGIGPIAVAPPPSCALEERLRFETLRSEIPTHLIRVSAREHRRMETSLVECLVFEQRGLVIRTFAAKDIRHMFEPLCTTNAEGLGMGRAIARTIIEARGGRLTATHSPVGGATFQFTQPSTRAAPR